MTMLKPIAFISETTGHFYMITEKNNSWEQCWQSTAFIFLWKWPATSDCVWSEPSYYISINFRRHHLTTLYIRTLGPRLLRDPRYYIWRKMLCDASKHGVVVVGRKHHITLIREKIKWIISISNGTLGWHGST